MAASEIVTRLELQFNHLLGQHTHGARPRRLRASHNGDRPEVSPVGGWSRQQTCRERSRQNSPVAMKNQTKNQAKSREQDERARPVAARMSSTLAREMLCFGARRGSRQGKNAKATASLPTPARLSPPLVDFLVQGSLRRPGRASPRKPRAPPSPPTGIDFQRSIWLLHSLKERQSRGRGPDPAELEEVNETCPRSLSA